MGFGDELMALGEAQALYQATGEKVCIVDRNGKPRSHPLWEGAEALEPNGRPYANGGHCRPYIDYERSTPERWVWKEYQPKPASLPWLRPDQRGAAKIIIEPTIKANASPNKQWGGWREFAARCPHPLATVGPAPVLEGVEHIQTADFKAGVNVLASARAAVLPEGGLHHACAAVGLRCVVISGAHNGPYVTGYADQEWLWVDCPDAQGWRVPHPAVERAWKQITVDAVLKALEKILAA